MTYATKNSIILGVMFLLIAGGGGVYVFLMQAGELKDISKEREEIRAKFQNVAQLQDQLERAKYRAESLDVLWRLRPKTMPTTEKASYTNMYLNQILRLSPELDLNVITQEQVEQQGCGYVRYHLAGQGPFDSFARLVQYLEFGPRVMKLNNVDLREVHRVDDELGIIVHEVQFDADLLAYYSDQPLFADSADLQPLSQTRIPVIANNPFRSIVTIEIPPNVHGLPEVENSTLVSLTEDFAYIIDQSGQSVELEEGDRVYLGYVSKIMFDRKQVEFQLNKGGIQERYILTWKEYNLNDIKSR
ncbi:MAG: hypothetical protein CL946_01520 [Ectothiorhodospiraceae bacterium]|nr:hypothetical protein [Ectothiorhodospiraceae bacterium]